MVFGHAQVMQHKGFLTLVAKLAEDRKAFVHSLAALVFIYPNLIIPFFPWQLTPLTARSLCGWLIALGSIMLSLSYENSRTRSRLATPMLMLVLPALLLQMMRYAEQVSWSNPGLWMGLLFFAIVGFCGLYLANGSWRDALS